MRRGERAREGREGVGERREGERAEGRSVHRAFVHARSLSPSLSVPVRLTLTPLRGYSGFADGHIKVYRAAAAPAAVANPSPQRSTRQRGSAA